jgi:eukaryotic translation initiation factor 2-alpha kinase 3
VKDEKIDKLIDDLDLCVIVPDGIICGYSKTSPNKIIWKHKFESPVVSVYQMDAENKLNSVDLFENVQWL